MYKVLSIDGGGIRGVIPAVLLSHLEKKTGKSVSEMFDLIVGTSTGGILAAGFTVRNSKGKAKHSADDMLKLYSDDGRDIFARSTWRGVTSAWGVFDEKYSHEPLEKLLHKYLGNAILSR